MVVARLPRGRAPALKSSVERCVFSFRRLPVRGTHTRTCGSTGLGDGRLGGGEGRGGGREGLQPRWRRVVRALLWLRPASAAASCAVGRLWANGGGGRRGAGCVSVAAVGRRHVWRVMSAVLELRGGQVGLGCGARPIVWCPGLFLLADHCFFPSPCGFLGTSVFRDCPSRSSGSFVSAHPPSLCSLHARTRAGFYRAD